MKPIVPKVATIPPPRRPRPKQRLCESCCKEPADLGSKLCVGCDAYRDHTR